MQILLSYWGVSWDTALKRAPPLAPAQPENFSPDDFLLVPETDDFLGMAPPSKAVLAIQQLVSSWLGESHEAAQEAIVAAEIKRIRGELNRLRVDAGDTPVDQDVVLREIYDVIVPVIVTYAERFGRARGVLPEVDPFTAEWEMFLAHLLAGTSSRNRFSYQLESPVIVKQLVQQALSQIGQPTTPVGRADSLPGSWNSLSSQLPTLAQFPSFDIGEEDEDGQDEALAEHMQSLQAAQPTEQAWRDASYSPGVGSARSASPGALFSGTRGDMREAAFTPPVAAWVPSQQQASLPPPLEPGPQVFDLYADDAEAEEDAEPATHDPYLAAESPGRESQSTPRRWVSSVASGTDAVLRSPLAFVLSMTLMILTPIISSLPYLVVSVAFFSTIVWRHFTAMGTGLVLVSTTLASGLGYFLSDFTPAGWIALAVVLGLFLYMIWPGQWGNAEIPVEVRERIESWWWRFIRRAGSAALRLCSRRAVAPGRLDPAGYYGSAPPPRFPQTPRRQLPLVSAAQLAARQAAPSSRARGQPSPSLPSTIGQQSRSPIAELARAKVGTPNEINRVGHGAPVGFQPDGHAPNPLSYPPPGQSPPSFGFPGGMPPAAGLGAGGLGPQGALTGNLAGPPFPGFLGAPGGQQGAAGLGPGPGQQWVPPMGGPPPPGPPFPGGPSQQSFGGQPPPQRHPSFGGGAGGGFPPGPGGYGSPPPPAGAPSGGQDPYLCGGYGSSLAPGRRRIAHDTYWELRRQSTSVRNYMSQLYGGSRTSQEYYDLWTYAEMVDARLDDAYRSHGLSGVNYLLASDDTLEHMLSRIGAQVAFLQSGDRRVYDALVTSRPPGQSDLVPQWALEEARNHSKSVWQQEQRVTGHSRPSPPTAPSGAATVVPEKAPGGAAARAPGTAAAARKRTRGKFAEPPGAAAQQSK